MTSRYIPQCPICGAEKYVNDDGVETTCLRCALKKAIKPGISDGSITKDDLRSLAEKARAALERYGWKR